MAKLGADYANDLVVLAPYKVQVGPSAYQLKRSELARYRLRELLLPIAVSEL